MEEKKLTIILPMYNVRSFIVRTLTSIYSQSQIGDTEVILVDDGSPDDSYDIAIKWLTNQPINNWRIIRQSNHGLGGARNTGINECNTNYIWCIDTDDYLPDNALKRIFSILDNAPDLVLFCSATVLGDNYEGYHKELTYNNHPINVTGREVLKRFQFKHCIPLTVIKKELIEKNNIRFKENLYHEDSEFFPRLAYFAEKVYVLNEVLYLIRQNPNSITRSLNFKKNFDLIEVSLSLDKFVCKNRIHGRVGKSFSRLISISLNGAMRNIRLMDSETFALLKKNLLENKNIFKHLLNSSQIKHKIEGIMFKLSPKMSLKIFKCLISN